MGFGSIRSFKKDEIGSLRSLAKSRTSMLRQSKPSSPVYSEFNNTQSSRYFDANETYDACGYEEFRNHAHYEPEIDNHKVALERKFNNYDYQDISDFKGKSSKSAKIRASIGGAATIKSSRSSKSAKGSREINHSDLSAASRRYSSSVISHNSRMTVPETMSINMHSVALTSVHQKHMHLGSMDAGVNLQTNYDKQRVRMYTEKKALGGPKTPYDMAKASQEKAMAFEQSRHPSLSQMLYFSSSQSNKQRYSKQNNGSNRSVRSVNSISSIPKKAVRNVNSSFDQSSSASQTSPSMSLKHQHSNHHHHNHRSKQHRHSRSNISREYQEGDADQTYLVSKGSCTSLHDEIESLLDDMNSTSDKPKLSMSSASTPATSLECSPLNKPTKLDAGIFQQLQQSQQSQACEGSSPSLAISPQISYGNTGGNQLTSIVEVATPKETTFKHSIPYNGNVQTYQISEETNVASLNLSRKSSAVSMSINERASRMSMKSKKAEKDRLSTVPGSPKAVFSLEDTLRADEDFRKNMPTKEEFHASVETNLTKKMPVPDSYGNAHKRSKKNNNSGGLKAFLHNLFSKKEKPIGKNKIKVINQKIGVY